MIINEERFVGTVPCSYKRLGCKWEGAYKELDMHEQGCTFPNKTGTDLMDAIGEMNQNFAGTLKFYQNMLDFFSFEKVTFADIQLRPRRTEDFIPKLFYETNRFIAFSIEWVVRARVNDNSAPVGNPVHAAVRTISYQLTANKKPASSMRMMFIMLKGPFGECAIEPIPYESDFTADVLESAYYELPIRDPVAVNKLVAAKMINVRLVLIHLPTK